MEITVTKGEFYQKLRLVGRIVQPSKINAATEQFLFEAGEVLTVTGTNMEGLIKATIQVVEREPGEVKFVADAKTLLDALAELPEQPLVINVLKNKMVVQYHNGTFEVAAGNGEAYPVMNMDGEQKTINIEKKFIVEGIHQVIGCAGTSELRPILCGVYMEQKAGVLSFVSTDSSVLAVREWPLESEDEFGICIPVKAAKLLTNLLAVCDERVDVLITPKNISIISETYTFVYRLVDGRFPNYRNLIPVNQLEVKAVHSDLVSAFKRVSVFSNRASFLVSMELKQNELNIQAQDIDFQVSGEETLECDYTGSNFKIGFNATNFINLISSIDSDECSLYLSDPSRATVIKPVGVEGITLLIMPLLINNN